MHDPRNPEQAGTNVMKHSPAFGIDLELRWLRVNPVMSLQTIVFPGIDRFPKILKYFGVQAAHETPTCS